MQNSYLESATTPELHYARPSTLVFEKHKGIVKDSITMPAPACETVGQVRGMRRDSITMLAPACETVGQVNRQTWIPREHAGGAKERHVHLSLVTGRNIDRSSIKEAVASRDHTFSFAGGAKERPVHLFHGTGRNIDRLFITKPGASNGKLGNSKAFLEPCGGNGCRHGSLNYLRMKGLTLRNLAIALFFGGVAGFIKVLSSGLPPDFSQRWNRFLYEQHSIHHLQETKRKFGSRIYDVHGRLIATVGAVENPKRLSQNSPNLLPSDIPAFMWQAVVASEDRRFFEHHGIDPSGIARAAISLSMSGGGSTITQQLVKNVFLTNERKWARKLLEIFLALFLEKQMTKWDILYMYLKKIYWGHGVYGIEAASAFYFGKHPSMLTEGDCAMLTGLIPAPELFSPFRDPSRGKKAQGRTLRRMVEAGFLDTHSAEALFREPLELNRIGEDSNLESSGTMFFVREVVYELKRKYGYDRVYEGGLKVYTTLDLDMQLLAEKAIQAKLTEYDNERITFVEGELQKICEKMESCRKDRELEIVAANSQVSLSKNMSEDDTRTLAEKAVASIVQKFSLREDVLQSSLQNYQVELKRAMKSRLEAAMVVLDHSNGAVRVLVGGREYFENSFNRVTQAYRSVGSMFKPVVYLTALVEGIDPRHVLSGEKQAVADIFPKNQGKNPSKEGTMREEIRSPLSSPIAKLCAKAGVDKVCRMTQLLGVKASLPHDLGVSLGGFETTPLELGTLYSTIASGGFHHEPHLITRVETKEGEVLDEFKHPAGNRNVINDDHAVAELHKLLQAVVQRRTGREAQIEHPCAGTSGTSRGSRDAWFAGFTCDLTSVVWLGYDDNSPIGGLNPGTGASHAAPVWQQVMQSIYKMCLLRGCKVQDQPVKISKGPSAQNSKKPYRRSKHCTKLFCQVFRGKPPTVASEKSWKDVRDWEKSNIVWEEQEKMMDWIAQYLKRSSEMKELRSIWQERIRKWATRAPPSIPLSENATAS